MERWHEGNDNSVVNEFEIALRMYADPAVQEAVILLSLNVVEVDEAAELFARIADAYHVTPDEVNVVIEIIQAQNEYRDEE